MVGARLQFAAQFLIVFGRCFRECQHVMTADLSQISIGGIDATSLFNVQQPTQFWRSAVILNGRNRGIQRRGQFVIVIEPCLREVPTL